MKCLIFLSAMCLSAALYAQKYDFIWVIGDSNQTADTMHGGAIIDFNQLPVGTKYHYREMNMFVCNASISDSAGNLLFYSNGCDIAGADDEILLNGNDINPGSYHNTLCDEIGRGYFAGYPGIMILPVPETISLFYLFHKSVNYIPPPNEDAYVDRLLCSKVKIIDNKKTVLEKNISVMVDSLSIGEMNAVKHANGKDWWIISPRRNSNQFYMFLFTKDGIVDTLTQTIGDIPPPDKEGYGQTSFSPDGTRMIRYYPYTPIMNFTFDRSTGYFTDYSTFSVNYGNDFAHQGGCAISPNGRFLYIAALLQVYQFDLWASDISASQVKIAVWDGFVDPIAISFLTCQLGPDCKIYILGGGDTRYYHIIHNPDEEGLACNLEQRGLVLPTPSGASIPYFPNYRLGPIDNPGVPCTATVSVSQPHAVPTQGIRVWPNPSSSQVSLSAKGLLPKGARWMMTDAYGQPVHEEVLQENFSVKEIGLRHLPTGLYFWMLQDGQGKLLDSGKIIKL